VKDSRPGIADILKSFDLEKLKEKYLPAMETEKEHKDGQGPPPFPPILLRLLRLMPSL